MGSNRQIDLRRKEKKATKQSAHKAAVQALTDVINHE